MIKETKCLLLTIFILLISIGAISAHDNSTFDNALTADNDLNSQQILTTDSGNFTELNDLINGEDTTINLNKDYKYVSGDNVSSGGIPINKSITINGNGHTIDASNAARIFLVNANNVVLNNITFINGYNSGSAGAIGVNDFENFTLNNCNFINNTALSAGGAVYSMAKNTQINSCNFTSNHASASAGAAYIRGVNSIISNSSFESNNGTYGGAIRIFGDDSIVNNSSFSSNIASVSGGSVYWQGTRGKFINCSVINDSAVYGGSIFWFGSYADVEDSVFESNSAKSFGGALYFYNSYVALKNSTFKNNAAVGGSGGAIYSDDYYNKISDCIFQSNTAAGVGGGLALWSANYATLTNNYFDSNNATHHGGGMYIQSYRVTVDNSTFDNCYASSGGGIYIVYSETNTNSYSYSTISNSNFRNNTVRYGGAGITATSHTTISNSNFTGNTAGNYGGAVDLTNSRLTNSNFENNSAIYGGAIYVYNSDIINSTFADNDAAIGNSIYILNISNLQGNNVADEDVFLFTHDPHGAVSGNEHNIEKLMFTDKGYYAFCAERYNLSPYTGVYDSSMEKLLNSITHQPIGEYLKILIYNFVDHLEDLRVTGFHNYVWAFTDYEYWNSTDPIVQEVVKLYNSGFRVPSVNATKVLANGTLMYFNFSSMVTPSGQQNLFLFQFAHGDEINETLTKEALNKTAFVNDIVEYRIVISNKGTSAVYDNWIEDKDYSKGLKYETWESEIGNWTYNNETEHWILDVLQPGQSASIILRFRVLINGTLYNNATSGLGTVNITNDTEEIRVYNPNFTVEKISLNRTLELAQQAEFEIVVTNTGDIDLTDVFVDETSYEGLVYAGWYEDSKWNYSTVNEKHRWHFNGNLTVGEVASFIVIFNTTDYGNFTNVVVAGSNETDNKTGNNTTYVLKPGYKIVKTSLNETVIVGQQVTFMINVTNTGETNLTDIVVREIDFEGLTYDSFYNDSLWIKNDDLSWKLNKTLTVGNNAVLYLVFNTTKRGNFTNYASVGNQSDNDTVEVLLANLTVSKITINKTVKVGDNVEFEIVVTNTGDVNLENVFVRESKYDSGLEYQGFYSLEGEWKYSLNNGKHTFTLSDLLEIGKSASFRVIFKTLRSGNFTNTVEAGYNNTTVSNSTNTTVVVNQTVPDVPDNNTDKNKTSNNNKTKKVEKDTVKTKVDEKATGNPLIALLMTLILIPLRRFKN